jgi:hypothetical protein
MSDGWEVGGLGKVGTHCGSAWCRLEAGQLPSIEQESRGAKEDLLPIPEGMIAVVGLIDRGGCEYRRKKSSQGR